MAALPDLITVEQYRQMPDDGASCYELHLGQVVAITWPKAGHWNLQVQLMNLLQSKLENFGRVGMEFPYRAGPQFDVLAGDVVAISHERWNAIDPEDNLHGAPELVIEVLSPSNIRAKMRRRPPYALQTAPGNSGS